ncbi:enoyl-CoA hydratase-related protein [Novosphingobium sp. P6W]|uniref:enoyl-CoA hydratase-related protein n=1 Tax=Novosphingobium sp. P6W TaxID=1609758 RepID=UPI0005C30CCF|nr:enoyl-CoA hydratase-related protein [Novosphingobium sp. P6W]AXB79612.1 enoyl-CoA hydratase [Novosphingobium sp. P6W]KIS34346.1 enoyl-CoA hydratase [Novosphingobium sp. P6W]
MSDLVTVTREGALTIITINRPEASNALNNDAQVAMNAAFDAFAADDDQWVAIVTGAGPKAFCAGHDLKQQAASGELVSPPNGFGGLTGRKGLNKPVIAAVNGVAMGGGLELALACDIVVAAAHAAFALPEVRVGLAALGGGIQILPQVIGAKHAMGMLLTGRRVSAQEGHALGFVNEIAEGDVLDVARKWAVEILVASPSSVRATKEAVRLGLSTPYDQAIADQWNYPAMKAMFASEDYVEGPKAFSAKRVPEWKGR